MKPWEKLPMHEANSTLSIAPDTKLGDVLAAYPQAEAVISELIPSFRKLTTPALKHAVAKNLTIEQAAAASGVNLPELILRLRQSAGLPDVALSKGGAGMANAPEWVRTGTIIDTLDARPMLAQGQHPKGLVSQELQGLKAGQVYLLITPFVPGPLIELGKGLGCLTWTRQAESGRFETYFGRQS
jgi:hypothetical protein